MVCLFSLIIISVISIVDLLFVMVKAERIKNEIMASKKTVENADKASWIKEE
eukprot:Gb_15446 [translate_table: standard]